MVELYRQKVFLSLIYLFIFDSLGLPPYGVLLCIYVHCVPRSDLSFFDVKYNWKLSSSWCSYKSNVKLIFLGITACIAVMQVICVVDDEMTPRMKKTADGEDSKYKYQYGTV